jgi:hypothetical protein
MLKRFHVLAPEPEHIRCHEVTKTAVPCVPPEATVEPCRRT